MSNRPNWLQEIGKSTFDWVVRRVLDWVVPTMVALLVVSLAWWQQVTPLYWIYGALVWLIGFLAIREYTARGAFRSAGEGKRTYSVRELMESVHIFAQGSGPSISITPGNPFTLGPIELGVFNRLPLQIEFENLGLEIRLGDKLLGRWPTNDRQVIDGNWIGRLSITNDLSDNQAEMIRNYPSAQRRDRCPLLSGSGRANFRSAQGAFSVSFGFQTRGFIHEPPDTFEAALFRG